MKENLQTLDHDQKSSESTGPSVQCPNDENINSIGAENKKQQLDINSSDSSDSFDCSNASDISSLISGQGWKPPDKSLRWVILLSFIASGMLLILASNNYTIMIILDSEPNSGRSESEKFVGKACG